MKNLHIIQFDALTPYKSCFVTPCAKNELKPHENEIHETARFEQSGIEKVNMRTKHRKHRLASKIGKFFISNASIVMQPVCNLYSVCKMSVHQWQGLNYRFYLIKPRHPSSACALLIIILPAIRNSKRPFKHLV